MKLREHLYLLFEGVYGKPGNAYVPQHGSGYILIDCGRYDALDVIRRNMTYWNISEHKITHVPLAHGYNDHAGSSSWSQSMGAQIYVGTNDEKNVTAGGFGPGSPFTNHVMPPCRPDVCIHEDMDVSAGGLCIYAPYMSGHAGGSMLYHVMLGKEVAFFNGDMFFVSGEADEAAYAG